MLSWKVTFTSLPDMSSILNDLRTSPYSRFQQTTMPLLAFPCKVMFNTLRFLFCHCMQMYRYIMMMMEVRSASVSHPCCRSWIKDTQLIAWLLWWSSGTAQFSPCLVAVAGPALPSHRGSLSVVVSSSDTSQGKPWMQDQLKILLPSGTASIHSQQNLWKWMKLILYSALLFKQFQYKSALFNHLDLFVRWTTPISAGLAQDTLG